METKTTTREIMELLMDIVRNAEPVCAYRMVPARGWRHLTDETPVPEPLIGITPCASYEPLNAYISVHDDGRIVWRLLRHPKTHDHVLNQMEIDQDDSVIFRYYALSALELSTTLLDHFGQQRDE